MLRTMALTAAMLVAASGALADDWKDESGKRGWRGERMQEFSDWGERDRDRKLKYRTADGCEVERKWKKGEYEEKVKCKRR
jgi:hypothetical protein